MKFEKISYDIYGRFTEGRKYGINSRITVEGYQIDEYAAVRKNDWKTCPWTVDSFQTGIAILPTGCRTRKEAIEKYEEMKEAVVKILDNRETFKKMIEQVNSAPNEEDLKHYEKVNYCTTYNYRFDKVKKAAEKAGCIIRKADNNSYLDGGNIDIIGSVAMLAEARALIDEYNKRDAEKAEEARQAADLEKKTAEVFPEEFMQQMETAAAEVVAEAVKTVKKGEENMQTEEKTTAAVNDGEKIDLNEVNADNLADYLPALLMSLSNDKHNSSIILAAGIEAGAIKPEALLEYFQTGRMPAVHTFDVWQKAGYQVRKGATAAFTARIWKYTEKKNGTYTEEEAASLNSMVVNADGSDMVQAGDEKISHNFIKKLAFFFTASQVEKTPEPAPLPDLPEDVKKETRGGCCWISGNTYAIKDALKAAGFRWSKKNTAWYRREAA